MSIQSAITVLISSGEFGFETFLSAYEFARLNDGEIFANEWTVDNGEWSRRQCHITSTVHTAINGVYRDAERSGLAPTVDAIAAAADSAVSAYIGQHGWETGSSLILRVRADNSHDGD